ncbi:glycosyltransferase [Oligoflexia bacterium]|nr:glycosyltransferase [Oligoflexia bacterium]
MKQVTIYTDFGNMGAAVERCGRDDLSVRVLPRAASWFDAAKLARECSSGDLFIINGNLAWLYKLCLLKLLLGGGFKAKLIAVDLVLRAPVTPFSKVTGLAKRFLFGAVDHFIHYFRNLAGYELHFGIPASKSSYLPFKANILDLPKEQWPALSAEYVYMAGRSLRDYETFVAAARLTKLPTAVLNPKRVDELAGLEKLGELPSNLSILPDDGSLACWNLGLARARVVVLAIQPSSICASGISTCLDAMALEKPVIITSGPGAEDVFVDEVLFVPSADPTALAEAIMRFWENDQEQQDLLNRASTFVAAVGGERQLLDRILCKCLEVSLG